LGGRTRAVWVGGQAHRFIKERDRRKSKPRPGPKRERERHALILQRNLSRIVNKRGKFMKKGNKNTWGVIQKKIRIFISPRADWGSTKPRLPAGGPELENLAKFGHVVGMEKERRGRVRGAVLEQTALKSCTLTQKESGGPCRDRPRIGERANCKRGEARSERGRG